MLYFVYLLIQLLLSIAYIFIILRYSYGWNKLKEWSAPSSKIPSTLVSVIIAARNEEASIAACIQAILAQSYPTHLFEVIIVNDHSTDNTSTIVQSFSNKQVQLLELEQYIKASGKKGTAYKKAAIEYGIKESKGKLIVTTDADCIVQEHWLLNLVTAFLVWTSAEAQTVNAAGALLSRRDLCLVAVVTLVCSQNVEWR